MKKTILIACFFAFVAISCEVADNPIQIEANNSITEAFNVSIPQTNGSPLDIMETRNITISDFVANQGNLTSVTINQLTFKFVNFSGDNTAVVQSMSLSADGSLLDSVSNVNIAQEAGNGTVYSITDTAVITNLQNLLLNNNSVDFEVAGSVISDNAATSFDLEIFVDMTAIFN